MSNQRLLCNSTNMQLSVTLYIQAGGNLNSMYGSVNVDLEPGEARDVEFGDLRNNMLSALRINPLPWDPRETYYALVKRRNDFMDRWLNHHDHIDISVEALDHLMSHTNAR